MSKIANEELPHEARMLLDPAYAIAYRSRTRNESLAKLTFQREVLIRQEARIALSEYLRGNSWEKPNYPEITEDHPRKRR